MGSGGISTSISSFFQRRALSQELLKTSAHPTMIELSHLQQDDAPEEDAAMRSAIMHRFLQAAEEVAAEHESSIFSPEKKIHSKSTSPSLPQQSQLSTQRTESRAQQAPKGFANSRPSHSRRQEDSMPHAMSGVFCLGLKTALFCAHRKVDSASGHSTLREKRWAPHPPNHMKVVKEVTSLISSEMEGPVARKKKAMERMTKYQSAINTDVPVLHPLSPDSANFKESRRRHSIKYPASFISRRSYPGSDDCTNAGCNPALSLSAKANLAGNQFENTKSKHSPHDEHVWARKFVSAALKEQEIETVQEGVTPCKQTRTCDCKSTCVCHHVENHPPHDLAGEINMSSNTFQDYMSGLEIKGGKSVREDDNHYEDDDPQFCDALSTFNSLKSDDTTFHSFGSPTSEREVLGFEDGRMNNEMDFTDVSSHFVTSHASTSENGSVLLDVCSENEKGLCGKMSSLSQRVGKGLKLETESKQAKSSQHDPCAYEQKHEQQAELQTKRFSRLRHHSLDSIGGLYPSKASAIFPMFPAKSQSNMPNALGWPFGISSYQSSRVGRSPYDNQQEKINIDKYVVGGNVPSPPLPPSPTESWLGNAVTTNASKTSTLPSNLLHKEKVAPDRRKLACQSMNLDAERKFDFQWVNVDAERSWEDVVKGSRVHSGH